MREIEILDILRLNPGSYIERNDRIYRIMQASGECLADQELWYEHVDDLIDTGQIVHLGRSRYVLARQNP
jgi:hypothetical protein